MIAAASVSDHSFDTVSFWFDQLQRDGYVIIPNAIDEVTFDGFCRDLEPSFVAAEFGQGLFYGQTTKRFGRLLARSRHAEALVANPLIRAISERVLLHAGCNKLLLNLSQAIEIFPGAPLQYPHRDQDMFGADKGTQEYMLNVMWALDDFTAENGATRVWPGSNHLAADSTLDDALAVDAVMPRGSALLFLGSTLHSGGANRSAKPRRGVIFSYCQGWLRPWENPWLAYPPEIARTFSPEIAALVGYSQHLPTLGNFEGQCPSVLLQDKLPDYLSFADALTPQQTAWVAEYQSRPQSSLAA